MTDPEDIPIQHEWTGCSFQGRVCTPEFPWLSMKSDAIQFLYEHGVFVELQFFLNRNTDVHLPGTMPKGLYLVANNKDLSSQIGYEISITNETDSDDEFTTKENLVHWSSTKYKRVTRSQRDIRNDAWSRHG